MRCVSIHINCMILSGAAGLFDYFKDKHFTFLIRKYINCLTDDGEMVISNFSTKNPTKRFMEVYRLVS